MTPDQLIRAARVPMSAQDWQMRAEGMARAAGICKFVREDGCENFSESFGAEKCETAIRLATKKETE